MESGTSLSKVITGTPRSTASFTAPLTLLASLAERRIALAPEFTASEMRCACTAPSSLGGVSQSILTVIPCSFDSSAAAASAPCLPERKTGLVELLAIIAMVKVLPPAAVAAPLAASPPPPHAGDV